MVSGKGGCYIFEGGIGGVRWVRGEGEGERGRKERVSNER